ncbi:hypothetical protein D9619_013478 [Psilocybe cf. subviscida]|uniref:Uncharacterized protein n=1 Tax=Psilocybe cf. subviscida TaxID=2480587 RepID=A0A8H5BH46_9AGAR|nr:hypothetical protein D9619_013478 [Psilocybe cf. subviscida]
MTFLHYEYPNGNKMTPSGHPSGATAPTESAEAFERVLTCLMVLDDNDDLHAVDLLNFWQEHKRLYPLFSRAAMDVLPTQASTVPSDDKDHEISVIDAPPSTINDLYQEGRITELDDLALAATFYIAGFEDYGHTLLAGFDWGATFWDVSKPFLKKHQACTSAAEVDAAQAAIIAELERDWHASRAQKDTHSTEPEDPLVANPNRGFYPPSSGSESEFDHDRIPEAESEEDEELGALGSSITLKAKRVDRLGNTIESSNEEERPTSGTHTAPPTTSKEPPESESESEENSNEDDDEEPPHPRNGYLDAGRGKHHLEAEGDAPNRQAGGNRSRGRGRGEGVNVNKMRLSRFRR